MIAGLGIDVVSVARIQRSMRNERFLYRILTAAEREANLTAEYVAGRWAAKEAIVKCVGRNLTWQLVEVLGQGGAPIARLDPPLTDGMRLHVSISHEREYAAAVAILENTIA